MFGGINRHWPDVEVDEATFGKIKLNDNAVTWNNYIGLIHRGVPSSLVILKLPSRTTSAKSPGPGPLLLKHWVPIAERYISGRGVILHTDSAKAYLKEFPRVAHTRVTSKTRKRVSLSLLIVPFFFFGGGGGVRGLGQGLGVRFPLGGALQKAYLIGLDQTLLCIQAHRQGRQEEAQCCGWDTIYRWGIENYSQRALGCLQLSRQHRAVTPFGSMAILARWGGHG